MKRPTLFCTFIALLSMTSLTFGGCGSDDDTTSETTPADVASADGAAADGVAADAGGSSADGAAASAARRTSAGGRLRKSATQRRARRHRRYTTHAAQHANSRAVPATHSGRYRSDAMAARAARAASAAASSDRGECASATAASASAMSAWRAAMSHAITRCCFHLRDKRRLIKGRQRMGRGVLKKND